MIISYSDLNLLEQEEIRKDYIKRQVESGKKFIEVRLSIGTCYMCGQEFDVVDLINYDNCPICGKELL